MLLNFSESDIEDNLPIYKIVNKYHDINIQIFIIYALSILIPVIIAHLIINFKNRK